MSYLFQIADRVLNRPLLITPDKANVILGVLGGRIGIDASRFVGSPVERDESGRAVNYKPYRVQDGVAILSVTGSLVNRGAWIEASSGFVSYEGFKFQIAEATRDPKVDSIILDFNSPGGMVDGVFEAAGAVRAASKQKRVVALADGMACSAAYALASQATEIVVTDTGVLGSIGVVLIHADYSRALEKEGIAATLIYAGEHKVDGNPYQPLPDTVKAELQAEIDGIYTRFVQLVGKGRGERMNTEAARGTKARVFGGGDAVAARLADRVGTFESVLSDLTRGRSGRSPSAKGVSMTENSNGPVVGFSQADVDRARAEGKAEGLKEGAAAASARIKAILGSEEAKGREAQAQAIAFATDMCPEAAAAVLAAGPQASAAQAFFERQANNPANAVAGVIGAQGDQPPSEPKGAERGAAIAAKFKKTTGR